MTSARSNRVHRNEGAEDGTPRRLLSRPLREGGGCQLTQVGAGSTKKDTPKKGTWNPISINQTLYENFCGFELKFLR